MHVLQVCRGTQRQEVSTARVYITCGAPRCAGSGASAGTPPAQPLVILCRALRFVPALLASASVLDSEGVAKGGSGLLCRSLRRGLGPSNAAARRLLRPRILQGMDAEGWGAPVEVDERPKGGRVARSVAAQPSLPSPSPQEA